MMATAIRVVLRDNRAVWAFGVLGVTWLAAIAFADGFGSVASVRYLVQTASFLGIVAIGQTLVVMMSGIDLSVSAVVALSAVVCAQVASGSGGAAGMLVALAVSVLVGLVNAAGLVWLHLPPMVMTLATGTVISGAQQLQRPRAATSGPCRTARTPGRSATATSGSSGRSGWPRSSRKICMLLAMLPPIIACRAAGDSVPPARAASSCSAISHTFSLSTRVPSMSKSTAAGRRAFRVGLPKVVGSASHSPRCGRPAGRTVT